MFQGLKLKKISFNHNLYLRFVASIYFFGLQNYLSWVWMHHYFSWFWNHYQMSSNKFDYQTCLGKNSPMWIKVFVVYPSFFASNYTCASCVYLLYRTTQHTYLKNDINYQGEQRMHAIQQSKVSFCCPLAPCLSTMQAISSCRWSGHLVTYP